MKRDKPPTDLSDQKLYANVKKRVGSNYYNKSQTTAALTRLERKGLLFRECQEPPPTIKVKKMWGMTQHSYNFSLTDEGGAAARLACGLGPEKKGDEKEDTKKKAANKAGKAEAALKPKAANTKLREGSGCSRVNT